MTSIVCIADLHEHLVDVPPCELLLIAGDLSFAFRGDLVAKQAFLVGDFKDWLERVPAAHVVLVAGNHDQSIEAHGLLEGLRCHYLEDSGVELFGLQIWGTPWQPWFYDWAFNARVATASASLRRSSTRFRTTPTSSSPTARRAATATAPLDRAATSTSARPR